MSWLVNRGLLFQAVSAPPLPPRLSNNCSGLRRAGTNQPDSSHSQLTILSLSLSSLDPNGFPGNCLQLIRCQSDCARTQARLLRCQILAKHVRPDGGGNVAASFVGWGGKSGFSRERRGIPACHVHGGEEPTSLCIPGIPGNGGFLAQKSKRACFPNQCAAEGKGRSSELRLIVWVIL